MARAEWTEEDLQAHLARLARSSAKRAGLAEPMQADTTAQITEQAQPKKSKYRNVKTQADGLMFDSRREADYWLVLRARQDLGEIRDLRRQVDFPLFCPVFDKPEDKFPTGVSAQASTWIADFVYIDNHDGLRHVVDAKGHKTQIYKLKKKWLFLQHSIEIEEV